MPIVYVKITNDTILPSNVEEYNQLEYVQTWFTKYEDRFLLQYRVKLLNTSKRVIPTKLIYVGNFANSICPQKEFIPHSKENIVSVSWKQFDETFETKRSSDA